MNFEIKLLIRNLLHALMTDNQGRAGACSEDEICAVVYDYYSYSSLTSKTASYQVKTKVK